MYKLKREYSWEDFDRDSKELCNILTDVVMKESQIDSIVSIGCGGFVLGTLLKNRLRLPLRVVMAESYDEQFRRDLKIESYGLEEVKGNHLIVDDLVDSGQTMKQVIDHLSGEEVNILTAVLFYKSGASIKPSIYMHEVSPNTWLIFPWE